MCLFKTQGRILAWFFAIGGTFLFLTEGGAVAQPENSQDERRPQGNRAIEKKKEKGFEGVDFSYDLFGAPPGQSATKIAEEVMAKDVADKPKVMAKQVQLLKERYRLDCKIHSGVMMTKGKPQPIGPTVQLKEGVGWDKLSEMTPEEIRKQKVFPAGFMRLPACQTRCRWAGLSSKADRPVSSARTIRCGFRPSGLFSPGVSAADFLDDSS